MGAATWLLGVSLWAAAAGPPGPVAFTRAFVSVNQVPATLRTGDGRLITVLDTREAKEHKKAHLPGAVHVDWTDFRRGWLREGRLPKDLQALANDLAAIGVDEGRPVLVCGAADRGWGEEGRVAWMLRYLGHPDVAILDGGCRAWSRAGRMMVRGEPVIRRGTFKAKINKALRAELDQVKQALQRGPAGTTTTSPSSSMAPQLLDVRRREEYDGATPYYAARGGHVPGARHLYWKDLIDSTTGRVRSREDVRRRAEAAGIDLSRPVLTYCTGGVRSAHAALVLRAAGIDARNYDRSWWEYAAADALPVEK
jgi:thiosulfate/3-mercaptopyruvate sulfurtransferase